MSIKLNVRLNERLKVCPPKTLLSKMGVGVCKRPSLFVNKRFIVMVAKGVMVFLSFMTMGCATNLKYQQMTNSQYRWATMGIAAPIGAGVGALSAPDREKKAYHALAWASAFVAASAIFGNYHYSDDKEIEKLRKQVKDYENSLRPHLLNEGSGYLKHPSLDKTKPVKWKVYKIDKWVQENEATKYHQDLMLKLEPMAKGKGKNQDKSKENLKEQEEKRGEEQEKLQDNKGSQRAKERPR